MSLNRDKTPMRQQAGFGFVMAIVAIFVLAVVGLAGYTVYNRSRDNAKTDTATSTTDGSKGTEVQTSDVTEIKTTSDLDQAATTLDKLDSETDTTDTTQLDGQIDSL